MNSYVVVFPSPFARSKSALLASNVKKILKVKELAYDSIRRDGQIIIVDAKDPVFASSAIGLLYGIERVAIAKKVGNGFDETVKEMAKVGSSLLLREDKFFIKVGGVPLGTTVADLELAATSAIIESSSESGALPGTANDHNRTLSMPYKSPIAEDAKTGSFASTIIICPSRRMLSYASSFTFRIFLTLERSALLLRAKGDGNTTTYEFMRVVSASRL